MRDRVDTLLHLVSHTLGHSGEEPRATLGTMKSEGRQLSPAASSGVVRRTDEDASSDPESASSYRIVSGRSK